jgi:ribonuclease HI
MNENDVTEIYTDGSCSPNPGIGGWAYVIPLENDYYIVDYKCKKDTTNNVMELTAVIEAIKGINKPIRIYTDSTYVIKCAKGEWKKNKNLELWKEYEKVSKNKKIEFVWVKGHNGNKYNEIADIFAKRRDFDI